MFTSKTLAQKNGVKTLKSYSKALEKKGGFTQIIRLGADLAHKCRNESNGRRVKSAHIFKYYGLENLGVGQIGILSTFSGGDQFSRYRRLAKGQNVTSQASDWQGKRVNHPVFCCRILRGRSAPLKPAYLQRQKPWR